MEETINLENSMLKGKKAMIFSFLPWILSWILIERNFILGGYLPLILIFLLVIVKVRKEIETTFLDQASLVYFSFLSIQSFFNLEVILTAGIQINYFSMASIWLISLICKRALSIDYSKFDYDEETIQSELFIKINVIISLVWVAVFTLQGISMVLLKKFELTAYSPGIYLFFLIGLFFTKTFPDKYYEYVTSKS